ncbi:hypothetical protein [Nostoc sp. ChiQUE01b]|nr:hypothetical protein [Nostoc sp. ChiQUE01b]MDZ8257297.1 hypothetical protein [Nostoc sp. ChiQUE01b]
MIIVLSVDGNLRVVALVKQSRIESGIGRYLVVARNKFTTQAIADKICT